MATLIFYVGLYTICSNIDKYGQHKMAKRAGTALYRIELGIGTKRDYELYEELIKIGKKHFK